jgi:peptidoglycan/LPS O-acetylase OafA/YrhL
MRRLFAPLRPESGHLLHLDALRLIASAGIVIYHLSGFVDAGAWSEQFLIATGPLTLFIDMFFAVSGFVIAFVYSRKIADARSYGSFLRKRLARLVPLHWATLAIFVLIDVFLRSRNIHVNHSEVYEWRCLPTNFLLLHSTGLLCPNLSFNGVSWSISAEMIMYFTAPALFWVLRRNVTALGLMAAGIWLALTLGTHGANGWYNWTSTGGFIRAIPSFIFGAWLFAVREAMSKVPFAGVAFWLCVCSFLVGCCVGLPAIGLLLTLYLAVAFGVAADAQQRRSRIVSTLAAGGQLTYSSYMLHTLLITVLLNGIADRILHTHGLARNFLVLIAFGMVWPVSYLSLVLFEKPARRWISGAKGKASPSDNLDAAGAFGNIALTAVELHGVARDSANKN